MCLERTTEGWMGDLRPTSCSSSLGNTIYDGFRQDWTGKNVVKTNTLEIFITVSYKWQEIRRTLLLVTNRKSLTSFQLVFE